MSSHVEIVRNEFPALSLTDDDAPRIYFDNPAGTQVPRMVIERMTQCLIEANANLDGFFVTSLRANEVVDEAHQAMADMLNAASPDEIVFGQNMTSLTFHLSRSIGATLSPGDEIIVTRMDHDGNVGPWLMLAEDLGLTVRWLPFDTGTFEFDLAALDGLFNARTKLVCAGAASNLTGTINDVRAISRKAREAGALCYVDAVQLAPHVAIDVQDIGCDFLACSAYKFFGPHQGVIWGRRELLESMRAYKVRPASKALPGRYETGTQSHEGMAGTTAAVDYFAWIGESLAGDYHDRNSRYTGRSRNVHAALDFLFDYEKQLAARLIDGLQQLPGTRILGITSPAAMGRRVPTVSFVNERMGSRQIASALAARNIFVWSGHNYALELARSLDIDKSGGAVRVGPVHYNTIAEIDTFLNALDQVLRQAA